MISEMSFKAIVDDGRQKTHNGRRTLADGNSSGELKNAGGVTVLVLCTLSNDALYLYQVSQKYLKVFQSY